jgi:hypothetical protein
MQGARGGAVCWGTALQVGRSRVRFPMVSFDFFYWRNPSGRTMALVSTQPLTENGPNSTWEIFASPPRGCKTWRMVAGLVWSNDPRSFADGSVATGRASHARQVGSEKPVLQPCWELGVGLTTLPRVTSIVSKPQGRPWPEYGPKRHKRETETDLRITSAIFGEIFEVQGPFVDHTRPSVNLCHRLNPVSICMKSAVGYL